MDEGINRTKFTNKWVPIVCLMMVVSGVSWFLLSHAGNKYSTIIAFVFFLSIFLLAFLLVLKIIESRNKINNEDMFSKSLIGHNPKIRGLVYRFNKARLKERKAKARLSSDGDTMTIEIDVSYDQMNEEI